MYRGDVIRTLTNINNRLCRELKREEHARELLRAKAELPLSGDHILTVRERVIHRIVMRRTQMFDQRATSTYRSFIAVHSRRIAQLRREIEALGTAVQSLVENG